MSKTKIICHVVFATKLRGKTINPEHKRDLYAYLHSIFKDNNCWVYRMNGIEDHIHILFDLHPTVSLSQLMKVLKANSSNWLSRNPDFRYFKGWGKGYFAVSVSPDDMEGVKEYIISQEKHHSNNNFISEIEYLIRQYELGWFPDEWN